MKFKELSEDLNVRALVFDQYSELVDEVTVNKPHEYPYKKEFITNRDALTSSSVTLCCIVYHPVRVIFRYWVFDRSQLKCLC